MILSKIFYDGNHFTLKQTEHNSCEGQGLGGKLGKWLT
jgi:hypothetical protein